MAASEDPQGHLRKLFEWQVERAMTAVRVMAAAVGATLVSLIASVMKDGTQVDSGLIVAVVAACCLGLAYAGSRYEAARALEREYVVALNLLRELLPLAPLLHMSTDLYVD